MGVQIRLYNPDWSNVTYNDKTIYKTDVHGRRETYFEILYTGTASAAATELGGAANSLLDGTTTPVQIIVVSADANDTDAASGDARKVRLIGVTVASSADYAAGNESPVYSVEEVSLNGTTDVTTTRYYLRLIHAYCSDWGSGGQDAKGDITIEYPADTDLMTITATYNESSGAVIWGCDGYQGRWCLLDLSHQDADFNNT